MTKPIRIQLRRTKGFSLVAESLAINGLDAVCVTRSGKYGNPWKVGLVACGCRSVGECNHNSFRCETAADAVATFRGWRKDIEAHAPHKHEQYIAPLRGKNLACYCALDKPCHADVLLELANAP